LKRQTANGKRQTANGKQQTADGEVIMFDVKMLTQLVGDTVRKDVDSLVGCITLLASDAGLQAVLWEPHRRLIGGALDAVVVDEAHAVIVEVERQLGEYFEGVRTVFDVPLDLQGTDFQKRVWEQLLAIPYGETRSYGDLARALGDPQMAQAVGAANGNNPVSIIVPCHRVVGASGALTGYAGGVDVKAKLLALERKHALVGQIDLF
jgi:methylated-DNA-[protein]-cysteine S-methyltransferase